jgi:hypothetical protein
MLFMSIISFLLLNFRGIFADVASLLAIPLAAAWLLLPEIVKIEGD